MRLAVLQLDTNFPRIPGDVACPETYLEPIEIIRIPKADVASIVTDDPGTIEIAPFIQAARHSNADLIVTSCGFLAPFQAQIADALDQDFIASSLTALPKLHRDFGKGNVTVLTFDACSLGPQHYGPFTDGDLVPVVGLSPEMHLSQVIRNDMRQLDRDTASAEICTLPFPPETQAILLECTNLPPYKSDLMQKTGLPVFDILDLIQGAQPGLVAPKYLEDP